MKTILIVDDEPSARYGLRRALEAKYRIAEEGSAEAAREALPREQPDLVLLDVVLPGQDGLSFLRWMREQGSEVAVLMVSALDRAKTAVVGLQLGAAASLVKGFGGDLLGAARDVYRIGIVRLRARGVYGRRATEKRKVRAGFGRHDFPR